MVSQELLIALETTDELISSGAQTLKCMEKDSTAKHLL